MVKVDGVYVVRDEQVQAECLRLLQDLHPATPTRVELARLLVDEQVTEDAAQRAIRDLNAVGAVDILKDHDLVRLPLAVAAALRLAAVT
jgi:hypothetical protein